MANLPNALPDFDPLREGMPDVGPAPFLNLVDETDELAKMVGAGAAGTYANVRERLAALEAILTAFGLGTLQGLIVENGSAAPTSTMRVTADLLAVEGSLIGNLTTLPFDLTCDMSVVGKNGRIEAISDTWWYLWVGVNPSSGEIATALSTQRLRADLDLSDSSFEGLTRWRRVGAVARNGGFLRRRQQDRVVLYDDAQVITTTYRSSWHTEAAVYVPPTSRVATLQLKVEPTSTGANAQFQVRPTGVSSGSGRSVGLALVVSGSVVAAAAHGHMRIWLDTSQQFDWQMTAAQVAAFPTVQLSIADYEDMV